jgi:hypothetical protein
MLRFRKSQMKSSTDKPSDQAFNPAWLDDFGLCSRDFRVYMHISRRGDCYSKAKTGAKVCRINKDTYWVALKSLEELGLIKKISRRNGQTSKFEVIPGPIRKQGAGQPVRKQGTGIPPTCPKINTPYPKRDSPCPKTGVRNLSEKRGHKGNPEGDPSKGNPSKGELNPPARGAAEEAIPENNLPDVQHSSATFDAIHQAINSEPTTLPELHLELYKIDSDISATTTEAACSPSLEIDERLVGLEERKLHITNQIGGMKKCVS